MKKKLFGSLGEHIKTNWVTVLLGLSVVAAGALSFYTVNDINQKLKNQQMPGPQEISQPQPTAETEQAQDVGKTADNVPLKPQTENSAVAAKPQPSPLPTETPQTEKDFVLPVDGKIFAPFSDNELVYNKTMDDWRTHNGIDIAASKGSAVKSACDGTVTDIYQDGMLGCVVEIKGKNCTVRYCGLDEKTAVQKGASVRQNQPIGTVGEIPLEMAEQSHIHLEFIKDGQYKNPDKYLG